MKITVTKALEILTLEAPYTLPELKQAYRREIKKWHPDLNPKQVKKATEKCTQINAAYDLLESTASVEWTAAQKMSWRDWMQDSMPRWEKSFKKQWKDAYRRTEADSLCPGLHFSTCIEKFRRSAVAPPPEWFKNCLFEDTADARARYREHLLKIAPNKRLCEDWARKYFVLEFGGGWIFYLPSAKELLRQA